MKTNKIRETVTVGLIKGRHEMPVTKYIFEDKIENVFDFNAIDEHIYNFIAQEVGFTIAYGYAINQNDYTDVGILKGLKDLVVYVIGLACITASLIKICMAYGISLTLMHFDRESGEYIHLLRR